MLTPLSPSPPSLSVCLCNLSLPACLQHPLFFSFHSFVPFLHFLLPLVFYRFFILSFPPIPPSPSPSPALFLSAFFYPISSFHTFCSPSPPLKHIVFMLLCSFEPDSFFLCHTLFRPLAHVCSSFSLPKIIVFIFFPPCLLLLLPFSFSPPPHHDSVSPAVIPPVNIDSISKLIPAKVLRLWPACLNQSQSRLLPTGAS